MNKQRCSWVNLQNPVYVAYHDFEWGIPVHDDRKLFEMLILEIFQAGLSWECVLNKREAFQNAYDGFDVEKISQYDEVKAEALYTDPALIRHRKKVQASIQNAKVFQTIQAEWGSFSSYLWHWTGTKIIEEQGKTVSSLSDRIAADLKRRGMKFIGSTVIYAYLQAVGVIRSHEKRCFLSK